jgi:CRP/FNR family transcriptional regulator, cyclic AMP receptor protein
VYLSILPVLTESEIHHVGQLLCNASAFHGMPEKIARRLASLMEIRDYKSGEFLTHEGKTNSGALMIVVAGEAEISSTSRKDGAHLVHRVAQPGHMIGEVGFIDGQAHSASCEALCQMRVAVLLREDFIQMFESDALSASQLMAGLLRLLARRIRHANRHMLLQDQQILQLQTELLSLQQAKPLRAA